MTDKEIIKALECCRYDDYDYCEECPYRKNKPCQENLIQDTFDLINRQQATIEKSQTALFKQEDTMQMIAKESQQYFDELQKSQAEIERLQNTVIALSDYLDILGIDKTNTSVVQIATELNAQIRANVKSEAINYAVEKLRNHIEALEYKANTPRKTVPVQTLYDQVNWILKEVIPQTIDGVLKELEGDAE